MPTEPLTLDDYEPSVEELEELGAFDDYAAEELDAAEDSLVEERIGEWKRNRHNVKAALGSVWIEYEAAKKAAWANGVSTFPREYREAEAAMERATEASLATDAGYDFRRDELDADQRYDLRAALQVVAASIAAAIPALQRATQLATRAAPATFLCLVHPASRRTSRRTGTRMRAPRPVRRVARSAGSRGDPDEAEPPSGRRLAEPSRRAAS